MGALRGIQLVNSATSHGPTPKPAEAKQGIERGPGVTPAGSIRPDRGLLVGLTRLGVWTDPAPRGTGGAGEGHFVGGKREKSGDGWSRAARDGSDG